MSLNPFAWLTGSGRAEVLRQLKADREAERHLKRVTEAYKAILADTRYAVVQEDLGRVIGEQLERLVRCASRCRRCGPIAERIKALDEVCDLPRQMVWYANRMDQALSEAPDGEA